MNLIINHTSMEPIYEQIIAQIKAGIINGTLVSGEALPSVRALSRDLKISALTVKKAYDSLEAEGLVVTVHESGTSDGRAAKGTGKRTGSSSAQSADRRTDRTGNLRNISDYNGGWGMLIQLDHVKKEYEDFTLELDMHIPENRVTGLIGANGAGKSTTFKLMLGLIRPDAGDVKVFGKKAG